MKRVLLVLCAAAFAAVLTVPAWAGTNPDAVFALHAKAHTTKATTICTTWSPNTEGIPCSNYVSNAAVGVNTDVYLVVARGNSDTGIAGLSCGVLYDNVDASGVDVFGWYLCGDLEFTNAGADGEWPISGGGNRITWSFVDACQLTVLGTDGVHAVAGAFYVYAYSPDVLYITPNNNLQSEPELAVADCTADTDYLPFGRAGFVTFSTSGSDLGCNPCTEPDTDCLGVPVEDSTWGKIKSKYGSN